MEEGRAGMKSERQVYEQLDVHPEMFFEQEDNVSDLPLLIFNLRQRNVQLHLVVNL